MTKPVVVIGFLLLAVIGCSDDRVERQSMLDDCTNHYRAESYRVAERTCLLAANNEIVKAQWLLGNIYYYDLTEQGRTAEEALTWFVRAADNGMTDAQIVVAESYLFADGAEENFEKAYQYLTMAAASDSPQAEYYIGMMFYRGEGRAVDISAAVSWLMKAAQKQHALSINNLAWHYATHQDQKHRNAKKALYWAEKLPQTAKASPTFLDTQAAAYALAGEFSKAISFQNNAIASLPSDTDEEQLVEFQQRLETYQNNQPWIERK